MKQVLRNPYVWGAVISIIFVTAIRPFLRYEPDPPAVLGYLPEYSGVDQTGREFGSGDLKGSVYIASFISSTDCDDTCARTLKAMQTLLSRYERKHINIKLVSIFITPTTHPIIPAFGSVIPAKAGIHSSSAVGVDPRLRGDDRRGVDDNGLLKHQGMIFLTGTKRELNLILESGFKLHFNKLASQQNMLNDHTLEETVAIVDQVGGLRGFYALDETGMDEVFHRSQHVLSDIRRE